MGGMRVYWRKYDNRKKLIRILFLLYILGTLCVTFIVRETMVLRTPENRGVVLQPFRVFEAMVSQNHVFWFKQIFPNILLFVPFGFLLPMLSKHFKNPILTVVSGCIFSGVIEIMQYITGRGLTKVDDVITNTVGAAIGLGMYQIAVFIRDRLIKCTEDA